MSKKRYSSGSSRGGSYQGHKKSTSTQQVNQEDALASECLIRPFMERGDMEDPVLKTLFIGGSKPKIHETESELLFKRLKNCWMEKNKNYGMKEFLRSKMKECGLEVDIDSRWAKYTLMGAPLLISLKIWVSMLGEEKRFLKDFQLDIFRDDKNLSENSIRIQKYGYIKTISEIIPQNIVIHQWDQFPDKNPVMIMKEEQKKTFHFLVDDHETLHHINLYNHQIQLLDQFYRSQNQSKIQLVQQDWSSYICAVRGKRRIIQVPEKRNGAESQSSSQFKEMVQALETQRQQRLSKGLIEETIMSDQESQRSRGKEKEKGLQQLETPNFVLANMGSRMIDEITNIEKALSLAKSVDITDNDIIPNEIFPKGIRTFCLGVWSRKPSVFILKLNYEYLTSPILKTQDRYEKERDFEINRLKREIITLFKAEKEREPNITIRNLVSGCQQFNDAFYIGSNIIVYSDSVIANQYLLIELIMFEKGDWVRYFHAFAQPYPIEEMKKVLQIMNKLTKSIGFARIALDQLMICPLCAKAIDKYIIFKHSCNVSVDLTKMRGCRQ